MNDYLKEYLIFMFCFFLVICLGFVLAGLTANIVERLI